MPEDVDTITIPDTAEALEEFLNDDKRSTAVFANPETRKEFLAKYAKVVDKSGDISKQISEQVTASVTKLLKDAGAKDRPDQTQIEGMIGDALKKPGSGAQMNAAYNKYAPGSSLDGVTNGLGEFARLINPKLSQTPDQEEKFRKVKDIQNAYSSSDPASSGFLIPEQTRAEILQLALEQAVVRPLATVITMTSLTQKIPFVDSTSHASTIFGGMLFSWTEESATIAATEASFGRIELNAQKLTGGARVPNELWNDAAALQSWLMQAVPGGLAYFEDDAFLNGTGVGQPLGVFNSDAVVAATRTTASVIDSPEIYRMYSRMLPQSLNRAVWIANQETLPQLLSMTQVIQNVAGNENVGGSAAGIVQFGNISGAPTMAILGRPLIITEKAQALNTQGDLAFIDFGHYLIGDRQAISIDSSEHSRFMSDETELRIIERVDGRPWVQSAITPRNGTATLSPYVLLAAG